MLTRSQCIGQQLPPRQLIQKQKDEINLTSKPTGKRPLGRHRRRWEDNIRTNLK